MTAIGPLTTTFQAPSSCTTNTPQIYQVHNTQDHDTYSYVQGPLFKPGSNCFPSGYDASPSAYYSPGVCPQGYTAACTKTSTITTAPTPAGVPRDDDDAVETAFICCPTATGFINYTCAEAKDGGSNTEGAAPFMGCQMAFSRAHGVIWATVIKEDGSTGSSGVFTESEGLFAAHSIHVRFRASDNSPRVLNVPGQSSSPTTSLSPSTAASTGEAEPRTTVAKFPVPIQTSPPGGSSNNNQSGSETKTEGVSTGAAIGIAIGSAIAGILIFSVIGLFFFLRWRRKRQRRPPPVPPKEGHGDPALFNNANNIAITVNGDVLRPPYELSEEASANNSASRPRSQSRRLRMMSSRRTRPSTRRGVQSNANNPAELEAVVPSNASSNVSFRSDNRSNPESTLTASSSGWLIGHARNGVTPTPWI